jgi:hypothetical protein
MCRLPFGLAQRGRLSLIKVQRRNTESQQKRTWTVGLHHGGLKYMERSNLNAC